MQIAGYLKTSLIEWSGKICSVIFTPGCNFRCPFCHNPDLINQVKGFPLLQEEPIFTDLAGRKKWIDAVVITGGEPTLQTDLSGFLSRLKQMGFLTMIHTNGTRPQIINELLINGLTDYICMDLKGDFGNYKKFTGVQTDINKIKESIKLIIERGKESEFRTTVVPGLHTKENLIQLAKDLISIVHGSKFTVQLKWFLQQFQSVNCFDPKFKKLRPYSKEELESFQREVQKVIPNTYLRGA